MSGPRDAYRARREARAADAARRDAADRRIAYGRLATAVAAVVLAAAAWRRPDVSWVWLAVPVLGFVVLAAVHGRVLRARETALRAVRFYDEGLARLDGRPAARGDRGSRFVEEDHPYAADLDLFGSGSLFERLDATRTRPGEATLAAWLQAPGERAAILARQTAVGEMRDALDLREDLAVLGEDVRERADTDRIARWAGSDEAPGPRWLAVAAPVLAAGSVTALAGWAGGAWGVLPFLAALLVQSVVVAPYRAGIARALDRPSDAGQDLEVVSAVLQRFERERFAAPRLRELGRRLESDGVAPSGRIRGLARLLDLADARRNQIFLPFSLVLLWGTQFAFALARWRDRHGRDVGRWLAAVGELEALASLSGWAFEHPDDPFPEIEDGGGAHLEAVGLGHPMIREEDLVRNDVRLGHPAPRLLVVSGSNMSGKSTLLRAVGVNVVLALAGAPVHARSMRVSRLDVGATLRIQDSLQAGESRFYAEISRLREILDRSARGPDEGRAVLFLLDEILAGTNSHDRAIGSEAILRGLLDRGAVGLVTTHDLALSEIADRLGPAAANVHFEDRLEGDRMVFDYRMREGVVRRSNALALMRSVGLDV